MSQQGSKAGRLRNPNLRQGGENNLPRSFGLTLEAIRRAIGKSILGCERAHEMTTDRLMELFFAAEPDPKFKMTDQEPRTGRRISNWERAKGSPNFGFQHRYGELAGIQTGTIHVVSGVYAFLLEACNAIENGNRKEVQEALDGLAELTTSYERLFLKTRETCNIVRAKLDQEVLDDGIEELPLKGNPYIGNKAGRKIREAHIEFIIMLLEEWRGRRF